MADYILAKLAELQEKGAEITEVYFFDHGWDGKMPDPDDPENPGAYTQESEGGFTLGDTLYTIDGKAPSDVMNGGTIASFAQRLGALLKADENTAPGWKGPTIHLRSCYGGRFAEEFANHSGLQTTGWTGPIAYGSPEGISMNFEDNVPNYHGRGQYVVYDPIKGMGNGAVLQPGYPTVNYWGW